MSDDKLRMKSRTETPNGFWLFFQIETMWKAPFDQHVTFDMAVKAIIDHRKGNPRFNLATDYETVALELENYTAAALVRRGLGEQYVVGMEKKTLHPSSRMSITPPARGAVAKLVDEVKKDSVGALSLAEWIGDGSVPVPQEQADSRAAICLKCPLNKPQAGRVKQMVAAAITAYTKVKNQLGLQAAGEVGLKTCAACDCPLKLKVWVPLKYILSHTDPGIFPENCWIPKELKSKELSSEAPPPPPEPPPPDKGTITMSRWGAYGDVISATAIASRIKAQGYRVRFATTKPMMAALEGHPDIAEFAEHGTVTADINLDGSYENHPENRKRSMISIYEETARKQVKDPVKILGSNGHFHTSLVVTDEEKKPFQTLFSPFKKPWVVVVPKSGQWKNRQVPDETWKAAAKLVDGTCFWTGYDRIDAPFIDLGTRNFRAVMAAVACADLVVTVDTGPMHVAAALRKPILAIQQAFDISLRLAPEDDWTVFEPDVPCLKCYHYECPIDKETPPCTQIDPVKLAKAINARLSSVDESSKVRTAIGKPVSVQNLPTLFDGHAKGRIAPVVKAADYITVVLTVHKRHQHVDAALKSILAAGFTKVVITASNIGAELEQWLSAQEFSGHKVIWNTAGNNNDQWLAGVKAVTTPFTIIFHDDDLMLPGYAEKLLPLVMGDADFSVCSSAGHGAPHAGNSDDILVSTGVKNSRLIHDQVLRIERSLTPIRGCFPTRTLIDALELWNKRHQSDKQFEAWPGFVVGNDLLIWLHACTILERCLFIAEPGVSCNHHAGSATVTNMASGSRAFEKMYLAVKQAHMTTRLPTKAALCYIHDWNNSSGFIKSIEKSKPGDRVIFFTDSSGGPSDSVRIPKIGPFSNPNLTKDIAATIAFVRAVEIARKNNLDWFFWLEHDCRFNTQGWLIKLWQEHLSWKYNHVCSGSPVIWNLPAAGTIQAAAWMPYLGEYTKTTGLFPALEGWRNGDHSTYPNGALAWYHTETVAEWFKEAIPMNGVQLEQWCNNHGVFDFFIGRQIVKNYGISAPMKMGWLESSYSGCGDHYYTPEFRRQMLTKRFVAVHQEKDNSL